MIDSENLYKKAMEEPIFIPIKGYINYPSVDEEDIEPKKYKLSEKEIKVREHLEETYKLVGKLNYKELGVRYSTKENNIEKQIEKQSYIIKTLLNNIIKRKDSDFSDK